jgi:hypothetical protein
VVSATVLVTLARRLLSAAIFILVAVSAYGALAGISVVHILPSTGMSSYLGHAYTVDAPTFQHLWPLEFDSDSPDHPDASSMRLLEDGVRLGPAHSLHARIAGVGAGAYSHWSTAVYFSTSDNSDPRNNGRTYLFAVTAYLPMAVFAWVGTVATGVLLLLWRTPLVRGARRRLHVRQSERGARVALLGLCRSLTSVFLVAFCFRYLPVIAQGAMYWLLFTTGIIAALFAMRSLMILGSCFFSGIREWKGFGTAALLVASIGLCCAGMEIGLYLLPDGIGASATARPLNIRNGQAQITLPADLVVSMHKRRRLVTMPDDFKRTPITVPRTRYAFRWQDVLHIYDENNFRRTDGPFPAKSPRVYRIMVVGDSLTYGDGIEPEWTYPAQLERLLEKDYRVEVLNLGVDGLQSEDVVRELERMTPLLEPDLIVYGICLNDFLPSGVGQYSRFLVPLPEWFKSMSLNRARLATLLADGYQMLLLVMGIRADFYDDILADFQGYQERFGRDVARMNEFAHRRGLPPIVGIVLDQVPLHGGRGYRIAKTAEQLILKAGFDVIPTEEYYTKYNGYSFVVSHWEGHPDEQANAIFATMIADRLIGRSDLSSYLKSAQADTAAHAKSPAATFSPASDDRRRD